MEADEFKSENLCEYKGKTKDILIIFDREKYDNFRLGLLRKVISDAKKSSVFEIFSIFPSFFGFLKKP